MSIKSLLCNQNSENIFYNNWLYVILASKRNYLINIVKYIFLYLRFIALHLSKNELSKSIKNLVGLLWNKFVYSS